MLPNRFGSLVTQGGAGGALGGQEEEFQQRLGDDDAILRGL